MSLEGCNPPQGESFHKISLVTHNPHFLSISLRTSHQHRYHPYGLRRMAGLMVPRNQFELEVLHRAALSTHAEGTKKAEKRRARLHGNRASEANNTTKKEGSEKGGERGMAVESEGVGGRRRQRPFSR